MDATLFRPKPSSGTPVYLQLVDGVRHGLETGALRPDEVLPAIPPMAEALVVHPATVARAYRELEHLRLAVRVGGVLRTAGATPVSTRPGAARLSEARAALPAAPPAAEWASRARELESAEEVQRCLLPRADAPLEGLDYAGVSCAARTVTGDYYDFMPLPGHRVAIAIGDVCGKGVPAAILMAALRGYLHGATVERQSDPCDLVTAMNRHLHDSVPASRFATFFYGVYDVTSRTLEYVTAGHHPPIVLRRGAAGTRRQRLESGGLALGMMPDSRYTASRLVLEPGDLLVAFTDGITEAMNADGEEWGEGRLIDALEAARHVSTRAIADHVLAAAGDFARGMPQHDDMTLAVVRVM